MSERKFKKAKAWMGKDLSLHVNGGDKKIFDNAVLVGAEYAKFVGMGFLVEIKDEAPKAAPAAAAVAPAAPPPPVVPEKAQSQGTKSPAGKVAEGTKSWGKKDKKDENKKEKPVKAKEEEPAKEETPVEPTPEAPVEPVTESAPVETPSESETETEKKDEAPPSE